ncbi:MULTISPECIES: hypothetical protein [Flagellimonas]|uniref:Uncharacterized protein n=1 Tax=Flagellimonas hadalis TaxID=2597517 RepID=A0A5N5IW86_9FLAO|nr:hypothetical protein [Allomuricauda hadalis]KAB5490167.1 hypothetical protein FOT42_007415 [Allomuricauda hadalis]
MIDFNLKKVVAPFLIIAMLVSCGDAPKKLDKRAIAENYIKALNASDFEQLVGLFQDSVRFNEMEYIRTFDKESYHSLFQWDSVFNPRYEILDIKEKGENLHLTISKECERIRFLHEGPFISSEIMNIKEGKIHSIDIVEYVDFNDSLWGAKREDLVSWIEVHYPDLNGFIHDQTKQGAMNYQKAMAFYRNRTDSIPVRQEIEQ